MGRTHEPYIYDPPVRYSVVSSQNNNFNPKAVEQASRVPPPKKQKPKGPLIDFNRHPDSYYVLPTNSVKPMNPRYKTWVKWTRILQLLLRLYQLVGAIGLLVCVIVIRGTQPVDGWIIRVPAAVDILTTSYAIYHLMRKPNSRPPASSASYHFFALLIDAGLIPFYVVMAIMAHRNYIVPFGTKERWRTSFKVRDTTDAILKTTWLTATTVAGIHLATLLISFYLVLVYRKIVNMPPDMNPLESNLTSRGASKKRRQTKHKYKDSNISVTTDTTLTNEKDKRFSTLTGDTAVSASSSPTRNKGRDAHDSLLSNSYHDPAVRPVSFFHTRNGSSTNFSPHTRESARLSRADLPSQLYQQQPASQASLHRHKRSNTFASTANRDSDMTQVDPADITSMATTAKGYGLVAGPEYDPHCAPSHVNTRQTSTHDFAVTNPDRYDDGGDDMAYDKRSVSSLSDYEEAEQQRVTSSSRHDRIKSDNWFVVAEDSDADTADLAESHSGVGASIAQHSIDNDMDMDRPQSHGSTDTPSPLRPNNTNALTVPISTGGNSKLKSYHSHALDPLAMNPPTPQPTPPPPANVPHQTPTTHPSTTSSPSPIAKPKSRAQAKKTHSHSRNYPTTTTTSSHSPTISPRTLASKTSSRPPLTQSNTTNTMTSTTTTSSYDPTTVSPAAPKPKFYGDLATATARIRGSPTSTPTTTSTTTSRPFPAGSPSKEREREKVGLGMGTSRKEMELQKAQRKRRADARKSLGISKPTTGGERERERERGGGSPLRGEGRVVSRSGVDYHPNTSASNMNGGGYGYGYGEYDAAHYGRLEVEGGDLGLGAGAGRSGYRRREVSGKVVEEGRGGVGMEVTRRRVSGVA